MGPGVASFSPSQRQGALGALIRCLRSQGSGSDWGHRETARAFQYVWCLSCSQARQSLPLWGLSFGDPSGDGALRQEGPPGPTLVGAGTSAPFLSEPEISEARCQGASTHSGPVHYLQGLIVVTVAA